MNPYHVADATNMIKLDAMENPFPLPDSLREPYLTALQSAAINRYPDPGLSDIKPLLKQVLNIPEQHGVLFGNGSDEIIQIIITALAEPGRVIMAPEPSFVMYKMIAQTLGLQFVGVPLNKDYSLDEAAMLQAIDQHQPAAIFLAYPNNPTGNLFDTMVLDKIIRACPGLVVIDEAYQIFSRESYVERIKDYNNLVVMRTVSKAGLAGLRFGFLVGSASWLLELDKVRLPYNINCLTQASILFLLQHYAVLEQQADRIRNSREDVLTRMRLLSGIDVFDSVANFLLFRCNTISADEVFNALFDRRILIKKLHGAHPLLNQCLRVTVGTEVENRTYMSSLEEILS